MQKNPIKSMAKQPSFMDCLSCQEIPPFNGGFSWYAFGHDQAISIAGADHACSETQPYRRAYRAAPERQDHTCATHRTFELDELLRSGESCESRATYPTDDGARGTPWP